MNIIQQLIASDPAWLTTLQVTYKIHVAREGPLVSLKYNQIESPMHEPIVQACRGMVVDTAKGQVLAHPYNKFWNLGEVHAAVIDWATSRVLEKLDGSLMILYWDPSVDTWRVASSGTPCAGGAFGNAARTFREVFWETWHTLGMQLPSYKGACFMFELCTAGNRIVVRHDQPRLVLHGARDMHTDKELSMPLLAAIAHEHNWELVKSFPLAGVEGCLAAVEALDPLQCEGFIVVDTQFNRIKIKSPRYVLLHHMKGEASLRRAIELWQTGEAYELLGYFPEMAPQILPVHRELDALASAAADAAARFAKFDRKAFAARIKGEPFAHVAFRLFGGDVSLENALILMRASTTQALERMLEASRALTAAR